MTHTIATARNEFLALVGNSVRWLKDHGWLLVAAVVLLLGVVWKLVHPVDHDLLAVIRHGARKASPLTQVAKQVSFWGDFLGLNVISFTLMLVIARWRQRPVWVRLALASLVGACATGLVAVLIRGLLGRARPSALVPDGFYGPQWMSALHSCPSGHTATAFGLAIPLLVAEPRLGVVAMMAASSVAWSRMYLNQHYPADVLTSVCLSLCIGIPIGMAVRRQNRLAGGR